VEVHPGLLSLELGRFAPPTFQQKVPGGHLSGSVNNVLRLHI